MITVIQYETAERTLLSSGSCQCLSFFQLITVSTSEKNKGRIDFQPGTTSASRASIDVLELPSPNLDADPRRESLRGTPRHRVWHRCLVLDRASKDCVM